MKLREVIAASDLSVEVLDFALTALVKCNWSKGEIVGFVSDILDVKIEAQASANDAANNKNINDE
jgi:hypothetical protein